MCRRPRRIKIVVIIPAFVTKSLLLLPFKDDDDDDGVVVVVVVVVVNDDFEKSVCKGIGNMHHLYNGQQRQQL